MVNSPTHSGGTDSGNNSPTHQNASSSTAGKWIFTWQHWCCEYVLIEIKWTKKTDHRFINYDPSSIISDFDENIYLGKYFLKIFDYLLVLIFWNWIRRYCRLKFLLEWIPRIFQLFQAFWFKNFKNSSFMNLSSVFISSFYFYQYILTTEVLTIHDNFFR